MTSVNWMLLVVALSATLTEPLSLQGGTYPTAAIQQRVQAAQLRALRSIRRTEVSLHRIATELARVGESDRLLAAKSSPVPTCAETARSVKEFALCTSEMGHIAVKYSDECVAAMRSRAGREQPMMMRLDVSVSSRAYPDNGASELAWLRFAEHCALIAEQAAQMAEVAADQAITYADTPELRRKIK